MTKNLITIERLKELLDYNPETGILIRKKWFRQNSAKPGAYGTVDKNGYLICGLDQRTYRFNRLAWFYVYGVWPSGQVDHINGIKDDNRICNLRDVTSAENCQNRHRKVKGYIKHTNNRWRSQIKANGKVYFLGVFETKEGAANAYWEAKNKLHISRFA